MIKPLLISTVIHTVLAKYAQQMLIALIRQCRFVFEHGRPPFPLLVWSALKVLIVPVVRRIAFLMSVESVVILLTVLRRGLTACVIFVAVLSAATIATAHPERSVPTTSAVCRRAAAPGIVNAAKEGSPQAAVTASIVLPVISSTTAAALVSVSPAPGVLTGVLLTKMM